MRDRIAPATMALLALGALLLSGCSKEVEALRRVTGELSASTLRPEAEEAFDRKGHPIQGKLHCRSDDDGATVTCAGTTREGKRARFTGEVDHDQLTHRSRDDDGLPGAYRGTVGKRQVFTMNCFNCRPANSEG